MTQAVKVKRPYPTVDNLLDAASEWETVCSRQGPHDICEACEMVFLLRSAADRVEALERVLRFADSLLEDIEDKPGPCETPEDIERLEEATKLVRHHIGDQDGLCCGMCVLQNEVKEVLGGQ